MAFGATEARVLDMHMEAWNEGEKTPGPAAYSAMVDEKGREWNTSVMNGHEQMKSWTFASTVKQRSDITLPSVDNPGPGAYDPKDQLTIEHLPGANPESNIISKVSRDSRYVGDVLVEQSVAVNELVGPGSYDPKVTVDGALDTIGARSQKQKDFGWSASFISAHIRQMWQGWFGDNDELNSA